MFMGDVLVSVVQPNSIESETRKSFVVHVLAINENAFPSNVVHDI